MLFTCASRANFHDRKEHPTYLPPSVSLPAESAHVVQLFDKRNREDARATKNKGERGTGQMCWIHHVDAHVERALLLVDSTETKTEVPHSAQSRWRRIAAVSGTSLPGKKIISLLPRMLDMQMTSQEESSRFQPHSASHMV